MATADNKRMKSNRLTLCIQVWQDTQHKQIKIFNSSSLQELISVDDRREL